MTAFIAWAFWAAFLAIFAALGLWIWVWQQHRAEVVRLYSLVTELRESLGQSVTLNLSLKTQNQLLTDEVRALNEWVDALREGNQRLRRDLEVAEHWLARVGVTTEVLDALTERQTRRASGRRLRLPEDQV